MKQNTVLLFSAVFYDCVPFESGNYFFHFFHLILLQLFKIYIIKQQTNPSRFFTKEKSKN